MHMPDMHASPYSAAPIEVPSAMAARGQVRWRFLLAVAACSIAFAAGRCRSGQGAAHRAIRHRHARPAAIRRRSVVPGHHGDLRAAVRMGLPVAHAEAHAADGGRTAGDHGRRPRVDDPAEAGDPVHRRPRVQGQAARARRRGLRLLVQALARSERCAAAASRSSPTSSSARGRSSRPPRRRASSTSTRRSKACARSTATRCRSGCRNPIIRPCATCWASSAPSRARWWRPPVPTCAPAPSARARFASRNGSAARA